MGMMLWWLLDRETSILILFYPLRKNGNIFKYDYITWTDTISKLWKFTSSVNMCWLPVPAWHLTLGNSLTSVSQHVYKDTGIVFRRAKHQNKVSRLTSYNNRPRQGLHQGALIEHIYIYHAFSLLMSKLCCKPVCHVLYGMCKLYRKTGKGAKNKSEGIVLIPFSHISEPRHHPSIF